METREERGEESGISSKIFCFHVKMLFLLSMGVVESAVKTNRMRVYASIGRHWKYTNTGSPC